MDEYNLDIDHEEFERFINFNTALIEEIENNQARASSSMNRGNIISIEGWCK